MDVEGYEKVSIFMGYFALDSETLGLPLFCNLFRERCIVPSHCFTAGCVDKFKYRNSGN